MAVADERVPALSTAIAKLLKRRLAEVHTCLPGKITKYDQGTQLAEVQVAVKHRVPTDDGETIVEDFPLIPNVPVEHLQTASFFASFPVGVGDFVWLHIVEQSIDKWMDKGGVQVDDPIERRFNLKDCYATLARNPKSNLSNTESDSIVIGHKSTGPRAYFKDTEIALGSKAPAEFVALATKVFNEINALRTTVNTWTAQLNGHTHAVVVAPGPTTTMVLAAVPTTLLPPAAVQQVAATKVKAV